MIKIKLILPMAIILSCVMASCSKSDTSSNKPEGGETKIIPTRLNLSGEILDIEEKPMNSKAISNNLYAIQVYRKASSGDTDQYYAYGLFDDISNLNIDLPAGMIYRFDLTMVVDGKTKISSENGKFKHPFFTSGTGGGNTAISNSFILSDKIYFNFLNQGYSYIPENTTSALYKRPTTDRYYGRVTGYTPGTGKSATINAKRVVFGIKVVPRNFTDGTLKITAKYAPELKIKYGEATEISEILTFMNDMMDFRWTDDDYSEEIPVTIVWSRTSGDEEIVSDRPIIFKRKTIHTLNVTLPSGNTNIGIALEEGDLINGESTEI